MLKNLTDRAYGVNLNIPRYDDLVHPKERQKKAPRTADQIISNISNVLSKLGK